MIRALGVSPFCVIALLVAAGCGAADPSEPSTTDTESVQQAVIEPIEPPEEPAGQCAPVCLKYDPTGALVGACCICQGVTKTLVRSPASPSLLFCR
jgi:hypothetical protein